MDQLILWNSEEWMIAERHAQNHPGSRRGQYHGAHHWCVQIAHDFFEGKQNCRQRRIKCGCNSRRRPHRDELFHLLGAQTEEPSQRGTNARTNLDGRSFASQRNSASERCRCAEKLAEHGAKRDTAITREQRCLRLRNAAASCIGKVAIQQVTDAERAHDGEQQTPPRSAARRVQPHPHSFRQYDEGDNRQPCQGADHQRQSQKDLALALPEFCHAIQQRGSPPTSARRLAAFTHL